MSLLLGLLVLNAIVHGIVVTRFGVRDNNQFLVFALVYAVLTVAVYLSVPYALWGVLILSIIGIIGLSVTFNIVAARIRQRESRLGALTSR